MNKNEKLYKESNRLLFELKEMIVKTNLDTYILIRVDYIVGDSRYVVVTGNQITVLTLHYKEEVDAEHAILNLARHKTDAGEPLPVVKITKLIEGNQTKISANRNCIKQITKHYE